MSIAPAAQLLRIEIGAVYVTPTGRRCYWRPGPPSDTPAHELRFEYFDGSRLDCLTLTPLAAQRLLKREGAR